MALALANYGFGEPLCSAARSLSPNQFRNYLFEWRACVRDFLWTDPVSSMGSQHKALAAAMPDDFPNPEIVYLYLFPKTSSSAMTSTVHEHHLPDITQITQLCELYFPWATTEDIFVKFEASVFPAVFMSILRDQIVRREREIHGSIQVSKVHAHADFMSLLCVLTVFAQLPLSFNITSPLFPAAKFTIGSQRTIDGIPQHKIEGPIGHLQQLVNASLRGLRKGMKVPNPGSDTRGIKRMRSYSMDTASASFKTWVPTCMLFALIACGENQNSPVVSDSYSLSSLKPDLNVDIPTLQQLFVTPEIDASTLAKLICDWVRPNTISRTIVPVTCAFLDAIASAPDGESTFQLLRHFVDVCASLSPSISHECTLDPMKRAFKASGAMTLPVHEAACSVPASRITSPSFSPSMARITAPTFASFCTSSGIKQDALEHFEIES